MKRFLHLLFILLIFSFSEAFSNGQPFAYRAESSTIYSGNVSNQSKLLKNVIQDLEKEYKVSIMFDSKLVDKIYVPDNHDLSRGGIEATLAPLLELYNFKFKKIADKFYIINNDKKNHSSASLTAEAIQDSDNEKEFKSSPEQSSENIKLNNQTQVTGTVTDATTGETLPGVSVNLKGTNISAATSSNGKYTIQVNGGGTLVFSYIGYLAKEIKLTASTVVDVKLQVDQKSLNEVVVVGYGTQQKRNLTGSIASVTSKGIKDIAVTSFENAIQGQVAGVTVQEPSGEPGAATTIRVRGIG
jgi:dihydroneopterin aldolase